MGQVIIDFRGEPEFPVTDGGRDPKVEKLRDQLAQFADAYAAAKGVLPERIVLAPGDYKAAQPAASQGLGAGLPEAQGLRPQGEARAEAGARDHLRPALGDD